MIVSGAESGEHQTEKQGCVSPLLGWAEICFWFDCEVETQQTHDDERQVGKNIQPMSNAQNGSLVGKVVVGLRLRNRLDKGHRGDGRQRWGHEKGPAAPGP